MVDMNLANMVNNGATAEEINTVAGKEIIKTEEETKMTEVVVERENVMKGIVSCAIVSRGNQAVVFFDMEGEEGFYTSGCNYGESKELGHLVLIHNFLQNLNNNGANGLTISFQLTGIVKHFLNGRRPDKLDKLKNWVELDDRKQDNWKQVCAELFRQIRMAQKNGCSVTFTPGTGERTYKRAWSELNKIVPKTITKTKVVNRY